MGLAQGEVLLIEMDPRDVGDWRTIDALIQLPSAGEV
jgi:hypothetical protein